PPPAQLPLQRHQLAQQPRAVRRLDLGEVVLDPRRPARTPGGLEPVARQVDPLRRPGGPAPRRRGHGLVHHDSPSSHASRMTSSLRWPARPAPPTRSAISSRVYPSRRRSRTWRNASVLSRSRSLRYSSITSPPSSGLGSCPPSRSRPPPSAASV